MEDSSPIEVRNLDGITIKEEIMDAIAERDGSHGGKLVSIRKTYGGAQSAIILLPSLRAKKFLGWADFVLV